MAVIKERRNFQVGNIGVVKFSDAAERAAVSAMNNADKLINMAFKGAEREAKEAGVDLAESLNAQNIRTINPKTGLPEAFDSEPASFGKIASEAFEKTVDDRYRLSIEQEIKAKAASEAMAAESFDDPVAVYEKNFGSYVEEMKANATGRYKNFINVTGSAYLASTKLNLQQAQLKRERVNAGVTAATHVQEDYPIILGMITSGANLQDVDFAIESLNNKLNNAEAAGAFVDNPKLKEQLTSLISRIKPEGLTRLLAADENLTVEQLLDVKSALASNGATLNSVPEAYRESIRKILDSSNFSKDGPVLLDIVNQSIATRNAMRVEENRVQTEQNKEAYPALNAGIEKQITEDSPFLYESTSTLNVNQLIRAINEIEANAKQYRGFAAKGKINNTDVARYRSLALIEIESGLVGRIIKDNLDKPQVMAIQDYLNSRGQSAGKLPENYKAVLDVLIERQAFDGQRLARSLNSVEQDQTARQIAQEKDEAKQREITNSLALYDWFDKSDAVQSDLSERMASATTEEEIAQILTEQKAYEQENRALVGQENAFLSAPRAASREDAVSTSIANSWVSSLLDKTFTMEMPDGGGGDETVEVSVGMSSNLMSEVAIALDKTGDSSQLPKEIRSAVNALTKGMNEPQLKTAATEARRLSNILKQKEEDFRLLQKQQAAQTDILNRGLGNTALHKQAISQYVFSNNGVAEDFFRTAQSLDEKHPATAAMVNLAEKGRIPEIIISDLTALSQGRMIAGAPALLQTYKGMRSYYSKSTNRMVNLFVGTVEGTPTLSKTAMANLDSILSLMDIRGEFVIDGRRENGEPNYIYNTDQLSNILTDFNNGSLNSVEAKKNLEQFMASDVINPQTSSTSSARKYSQNEDGLSSWLLDSVGGSRSVFRDLYPYAKALVANGTLNETQIKRRIQQLYQDEYPETLGYVIDHRVRDVGRSRYSLSKTIPDPDARSEFISYVETSLPPNFTLTGTGQTPSEEVGLEGSRFTGIGMVGQLMQAYNGYADWMAEPYDRDKDMLHKVTMSGKRKAYLMPQRFSGDSQVTYMVMSLDVNNELVPVTKPDGEILAFSPTRREPN